MWDGVERRAIDREMLDRIATQAARVVLKELGLDDPMAVADIKDLRSLIASWRLAKRTAWTSSFGTVVKILSAAALLWIMVRVLHVPISMDHLP